MEILPPKYRIKGLTYTIRSAAISDAAALAAIWVQIDAETEFLDRAPGEGIINKAGFEQIIQEDRKEENHLFLVAETNGKIVGFSRCEGSSFRRLKHQAEFGVCVQKSYWGYGVGSNLLKESIRWADDAGLVKLTLKVLAQNTKAVTLYTKLGFVQEGVLHKDKLLQDGILCDTLLMARFKADLEI